MRKIASIIYVITVILGILGVTGYLTWNLNISRNDRIADFQIRTREYTNILSKTLVNQRDIDEEIDAAEKILLQDKSLLAVQVYSQDDGLRISVTKPVVSDLKNQPIAEYQQSQWKKLIQVITKHPMQIQEMPGITAYFLGISLTTTEIRESLIIILITAGGFFVLTLILLLLPPRSVLSNGNIPYASRKKQKPNNEKQFEKISSYDPFEKDNLQLDFDVIDDSEITDDRLISKEEFLNELETELINAEKNKQDVCVMIITGKTASSDAAKHYYSHNTLIFPLEDGRIAVIEPETDLDMAMDSTQGFLRTMINKTSDRSYRIGITSKNKRNINAHALFNEAEKAIIQADSTMNIVGFRSDPEKFKMFFPK